ncbi:hypothetical protein IKP85_05510 [bacterium]|nr:hypothetical protein [bacterium]
MKKTASSAIGMLLTMLIIGLLFITMMPTLKETGGAGLFGSSLNKKSVESRVNQQVKDIEKIRKQNAEEYKKVDQDY